MIAWNKGLTKETDSRIAQQSRTLIEGYASGRVKPNHAALGKHWHLSEEAKRNHSIAGKGKPSSLKGRPQSPELIAKRMEGRKRYFETYGNSCKGRKIPKGSERYDKLSKNFFKKGNKLYAGKHHTEEWKIKSVKWLSKGRTPRKTKPEIRLGEIIEKACPNQYEYSGDGSVKFHGYAPDFINVNGKKKVIKMFGDHWHKGKVDSWKRTELGRIMLLNSFGFDSLIIWEHDLIEKSEDELIETIKKFNKKRVKH